MRQRATATLVRSVAATAARRRLIIAFGAFIALGLAAAANGAAWPEMRHSFNQPVSSLAWLIAVTTIGYMLGGAASGDLAGRLGGAGALGAAALVTGAYSLLTAATHVWIILPILGFVAGIGQGMIDAGMNTYVAARHGVRAMGLLHAFFGIGGTLGPVLLSAALRAGVSWRVIFLVGGVMFWLIVIAVALNRHGWDVGKDPPAAGLGGVELADTVGGNDAALVAPDEIVEPAPRPRVALGVAMFAIYVAFEASIGQWAPSALKDVRHATSSVAGLWIAAFWAAFTAGRLVLGWLVARLGEWRVLSWSVTLSVAGALGMWLLPGVVGAGVGIVTAGLGLGAIFPLHISLTIRRVGSVAAGKVIGRQIAAAGLGFAGGAVLIGALVRATSLSVLWPTLLALGVAMAGIERVIRRAAGLSAT